MKNFGRMLFLMCLCITILSSCNLLTGPEDSPKHDYKNLVAFIAMFVEKNESGEIINRQLKAVVADFYNPSRYEIISSDTIAPWAPKFSRDKKKIIVYGGFRIFTEPVTLKPVILNDLEKNKSIQLQIGSSHYFPAPFVTSDIIWNYSGDGFYHSINGVQLGLYDFETKSNTTINTDVLQPWGLKGLDTLLVIMEDLTNAYLDLFGNVIGNIDNPYLEYVNEGGIIVKAAFGKDWNDELGLVVYKELNQGTWRLSITNLDGSYYRSLIEIEPTESNPVWGPENRYILYEQNEKILVYDLETDETRYFVTSEIIEGATAFMCPEF